MLAGDVSILLLFLINAGFRGAGDAAITMRALWLANGINILLGPLFVFGLGPFPRLGVTGAAVATTIGRSVGVLFLLRALARGKGRLVVRRAQLRLDRETMRTIFRLAKNGIVQTLIGFTSWIGLVKILAAFGSVPLAGYTIAMRVVMFALLPSWGLGNAAATLVGQNLGAGNPARAEAAVWKAAFYNFVFLGVVGLLLVLFGDSVVRLFTPDLAVVAEGGRCLRIVAAGFAFYAYGMVVTQAFNGAGDTRTPTRSTSAASGWGRSRWRCCWRAASARADGRLRGDHGGVLGRGCRFDHAVPARALEDREGLSRSIDSIEPYSNRRSPPRSPPPRRAVARARASARRLQFPGP